MSIKPRFANAILDGKERRAPPEGADAGSADGGDLRVGLVRRVLGTTQLDGVHTASPNEIWSRFGDRAGVTRAEFDVR